VKFHLNYVPHLSNREKLRNEAMKGRGMLKSTLPPAGELHLNSLVDELGKVESSFLAPSLIMHQKKRLPSHPEAPDGTKSASYPADARVPPRLPSQPPHATKPPDHYPGKRNPF
jgi:hypothetical protein